MLSWTLLAVNILYNLLAKNPLCILEICAIINNLLLCTYKNKIPFYTYTPKCEKTHSDIRKMCDLQWLAGVLSELRTEMAKWRNVVEYAIAVDNFNTKINITLDARKLFIVELRRHKSKSTRAIYVSTEDADKYCLLNGATFGSTIKMKFTKLLR